MVGDWGGGAEYEALKSAEVMAATWGHLEPKPGTRHEGSMLLMASHFDNNQVAVQTSFSTVAGGPGFYWSVHEYAERLVQPQERTVRKPYTREDGTASVYLTTERRYYEDGVYRFDGEVRVRKDYVAYFVGRLRMLDQKTGRWVRPRRTPWR